MEFKLRLEVYNGHLKWSLRESWPCKGHLKRRRMPERNGNKISDASWLAPIPAGHPSRYTLAYFAEPMESSTRTPSIVVCLA